MTKIEALVKLNVWNQYLSNTLANNHTIEEAMSDTIGLLSSFPWGSTSEGHEFWNRINNLMKDSL